MKFSNIKHIVKKELDKIFKFPRMIFSTILFPGLIIFFVYAVMGIIATTEEDKTEQHISQAIVINLPSDVKSILDTHEYIEYQKASEANLDDVKKQVKDEEVDIVIYFEKDFETKIINHEKPFVNIYYNSVSNNSTISYTRVMTLFEVYRLEKLNEFQIDAQLFNQQVEEVYEETMATGMLLATMLPMMIIIAIFAACLSVGADSIAGEKERGTLSTLLMLPINKTEIIVGKIFSTSIITICSAVSSFVGIVASLPFGSTLYGIEGEIGYTLTDYFCIAVILLLIALLASVLMMLVSTFAKNVKEATSYGMPLYIIAMLASMLVMFGTETSKTSYLIPIYNCTLGLRDIFSYSFDMNNFILIVVSTLCCIIIAICLLIKMFKNEKLLFGK